MSELDKQLDEMNILIGFINIAAIGIVLYTQAVILKEIQNNKEMTIKHEVCVMHKSKAQSVYEPCKPLEVRPNET